MVGDIRIKTREASPNTDLDMREFLGIDEALQSIEGELVNNTSKSTEINKRIKRDTKKLQEVENDLTYTDEEHQLYRDKLDDQNTEKQARLEKLPQNQKDLQTQVARIRQTIERVLDKDTSLAEIIRTLFKEQSITIFSILSVLPMAISKIVLAITGGDSPPTEEKGVLKKWLDRLADALKRLTKNVVKELSVIAGRIFGAILSFLGKTIGFVAENTWALIVFVVGFIGWLLMQKVKKD